MGRGPQEHLDAALELLDELGPADPRPGISMKAMGLGSGVSRSSVYRHWDSVDGLSHDLTLYAVVGPEGWQRRILSQPVDRPTEEVFAAVLAADLPEIGIWARTGLPAWEATNAARAESAAWEWRWLDLFTAWLDAHLAAQGRRLRFGGIRQLALAAAALVEGHLLLDQVWSLPAGDAWYTGRTGTASRSVARLIEDLTDPTDAVAAAPTSPPWPPDGLPTVGFSGAKLSILERATEAYLAAPFGDPAARAPGRLVDIGRLARRLQVSERRLYEVWPTTTDFNVAIVEALGDRALAAFERVADEVMAIGLDGAGYRTYAPLSVSGLESYVQTATTPGRTHMLQCTPALVDPDVREAFVDTTRQSASSVRTVFLAILAMSGTYRNADVTIDEYLGEMRAVIGGMQRLAATHPALLHEQGVLGDAPYPLCGLACYLGLESLTTDKPPSSSVRGGTAPPLPPRDS